MKVLVILAVLGTSCCFPLIQDTPEVIAERQRFFQLYNAAAAAAAAAPDDNSIVPQQAVTKTARHVSPQFQSINLGWTGPVAATIPAGLPGSSAQVPNTREVEAANRAFRNAYREAVRATAPHRLHQPSAFFAPQPAPVTNTIWTGPFAATIPAGLPGAGNQVRNTAEVEAAIAQFTRAYNAAVVATTRPRQRVFSAPAKLPTPITKSVPVAPQRWVGPFAATIPAGLPGSSAQVAETADVASAKAAFNRAFQRQLIQISG